MEENKANQYRKIQQLYESFQQTLPKIHKECEVVIKISKIAKEKKNWLIFTAELTNEKATRRRR